MATNEFLPFAAAGGANVIPQSDWTTLPARQSGYTAGIATSAHINKGLRQSASIAAMTGQFIANRGGVDALDNGDGPSLLAAFEAAYRGQSTNYVAAVGGTANAITIPLAPAPLSYAALLGTPLTFKSNAANTSSVTLNVSNLGAVALTWPDGTALASGDLPANALATVRHDGTAFRYIGVKSPTQITVDQRKVSPINFIGTWSSNLADGVQTQITGASTIEQSNLDDATFAGGVLTVGARTAGTWLAAFSMISPTANIDIFAGVYNANPSGTGVGYSTTETTVSAPGTVAVAVLPRTSGQVLRFTARQSGGGSLTCNGRITLIRLGA